MCCNMEFSMGCNVGVCSNVSSMCCRGDNVSYSASQAAGKSLLQRLDHLLPPASSLSLVCMGLLHILALLSYICFAAFSTLSKICSNRNITSVADVLSFGTPLEPTLTDSVWHGSISVSSHRRHLYRPLSTKKLCQTQHNWSRLVDFLYYTFHPISYCFQCKS